MAMYLFCLMLLHALSSCLSHDLEFEGVVRLGNTFLNNLNDDSISNLHTIVNPIYVRRSKFYKKTIPSAVIRTRYVGVNRTGQLMHYMERIKKEGNKTLANIGKKIMKKLELDNTFTTHINDTIRNYIWTMIIYIDYIRKQKSESIIDDELMFLDVVETASRTLHTKEKYLLNAAIAAVNRSMINQNEDSLNLLESNVQGLTETIYKESMSARKREMMQICIKYEVCRSYPGLTDYVADFMVELLKLKEDQLPFFIKFVKLIFARNEHFFTEIIQKDNLEIIFDEIKVVLNNTTTTQEALLAIKDMISQRFKIIFSSDLKIKIRAQAVRLLFDIIDKAFLHEHDEELEIEFNNIFKGLRSWMNGDRDFPESGIANLINNIILTLDKNWTKNAKKEVRVLIETILHGSSKDKELLSRLFSHGSKYVTGEDISNNLDII